MSARSVFTLVGFLALACGALLWWAMRPAPAPDDPQPGPVAIAPAALLATSFTDPEGRAQPLGRFAGKVLVLNFWATWCGPCREEMPAFSRLQARWADRGVQFVGVSGEDAAVVARFGRELGVTYPLWTGGDAVGDLSRRLGNVRGVLPHTAVLNPAGDVVIQKVGPYSEAELDSILAQLTAKSG